MKVTKSECAVIAGLAMLSFFWVFLIMPVLSNSDWFSALNPVLQYVLFNLGFIFLTTVGFGVLFALVEKKQKLVLKEILLNGLASWVLFSLVFDMWQPPYFLSASDGSILITNSAALPYTAVDAVMAYVWATLGVSSKPINSNLVGLSTWVMFILVFAGIALVIYRNHKLDPIARKRYLQVICGVLIFILIVLGSMGIWPVLTPISSLFVMVYAITPLIAVIIAAILLKPDVIWKMVGVEVKEQTKMINCPCKCP